MWDCDFRREISSNHQLNEFFEQRWQYYKDIDRIGNLDIRKSFMGGRTNNLFYTWEAKGTEIAKYIDVTSLYPFVLLKEYPIGHPKIITKFRNNDINQFFGFVSCKVKPVADMYLPPLPHRLKRLMFPLCAKCAEIKSEICCHDDDERALEGVWFTEELKLAISEGYVIEKIYQVAHFENRSKDFYKEYIKMWLKIKTEASGWPDNCETEEKKQEFLHQFEEREGN